MIALDAATILGPKLNRYLATAALLTLREDKVIADAVRAVTPKLTVLTESFSGPLRLRFLALAVSNHGWPKSDCDWSTNRRWCDADWFRRVVVDDARDRARQPPDRT